MKSRYFIIICLLIIVSLIGSGYSNQRTLKITPRDTTVVTYRKPNAENSPRPTVSRTEETSSTETGPDTEPPAPESSKRYVLNRNTKRFHYPHCHSVEQMHDSNKEIYTGSRQQLIENGYKPCGNCNP